MWLINGDPKVSEAVNQIAQESDRAVAIVAGTLIETRLRDAIQRELAPNKDLLKKLFKPSGAMGAFATKIDFALLLGLICEETHKDLETIKDIRNRFAHSMELASFDADPVREWCLSLGLPDKHIGYISKEELLARINRAPEEAIAEVEADMRLSPEQRGPIMWRTTSAKDDLASPRERYIMTAQILNIRLFHPRQPGAHLA